MYALYQFIVGIAVIHAALVIAYLAGAILRPRTGAKNESENPIVDIVTSTGLGIAAIGFATFFVGLAGALTPLGFALILVAIAGAGQLTGQRIWEAAFWKARVACTRAAARSTGVWLVWAIALFLAFPAAQPPTAYDALSYQQVYALEWAQHHAIFVDLFRRFPWYANNWLLIYSWFYVFHLGNFVQFLNWATGALAAVLVYAVTRERLAERSLTNDFVAALSPLPFLLAPVVLRWMDTGMLDVPIGFFFLLSVVALAKNIVSPAPRSWLATALIAGFLIGIKPSLPAFFPLFALLIAIGVRHAAGSHRQMALAIATLALFAAPWYVKNLLQDHDPVPPVFSYVFHHPDGVLTRADVEGIQSDLQSDHTPRAMLRLPLQMYRDPTGPNFREFGTTAEVLLIGTPFLVLALSLWKRRYTETSYWAAALAYAFAYWIYTVHFARYAILFYPLLTAFNARLLIAVAKRLSHVVRIARPALAVAFVLGLASLDLAAPSPTAYEWMSGQYELNYVDAAVIFPSRDAFLRRLLPYYPEEETVSSWLLAHPSLPQRVYALRLEPLAYYFAEHHIESIGDWVGPERYGDFASAVSSGHVSDYARRFDLAAVMLLKKNEILDAAGIERAEAQLVRAGFHRIGNSEQIDLYARAQ